jgi:hypothetical protein
MSDEAVRRALANLARSSGSEPVSKEQSSRSDRDETYRETIERATAAVEDVEAAAAFVEAGGLTELELAVERAEESVSACTVEGQRALAAFREFATAADGPDASGPNRGVKSDHGPAVGDQFHPGHGTSLGGGDVAQSK